MNKQRGPPESAENRSGGSGTKRRSFVCRDCGHHVECSKHGSEHITEYQHDMDGSWYYSCDLCVTEDGQALGSIVHWCKEGVIFDE